MWRALKGSRDQRRSGESRVKEKLGKEEERTDLVEIWRAFKRSSEKNWTE